MSNRKLLSKGNGKTKREGNSMKCTKCYNVISFVIVLLIFSMVWLMGCCSMRQSVNLTPSVSVDLPRYLGEWYEIARFDHWFERGMTHTKATYTMREDGDIRVVNAGLKDGKEKTSVGKAKLTDQKGHLRVSFFWPFYGDYRILWLDDDYRHVLVGGDSDEYLWILSRTPEIDQNVRNAILTEAKRRGYDTDKLIWVEQSK